MSGFCILGNSLKVTLVALLVVLFLLPVPLQAAYVTQPQTRNVLPTASPGPATNVITSNTVPISVGTAIRLAYFNSSKLGFELTSNVIDNLGSGFMMSHRVGSKVIFTINDRTRVNAVSHQLTFADYGNAVLVGNRNANPTVKYYEDLGSAPLRYAPTMTDAIIMYGSTVALDVKLSTLTIRNDYFVMEGFHDQLTRHTIVALWAITHYGAYASGVYFDMQFKDLGGLRADSYVIHWQDTNHNFVADRKDTFEVVFKGTEPDTASLPRPPSAVGCYHYGTHGWESIPCTSQAEMVKLHHLSAAPLNEGNPNGIPGFDPVTPGITYGRLEVHVDQSAGESDAYGGGYGAFSIQLNTNTFTGRNGGTDWVQFTVQNYWEDEGHYDLCIWQIHVMYDSNGADISDYGKTNGNTACIGIPNQEPYFPTNLDTGWPYDAIITGESIVNNGFIQLATVALLDFPLGDTGVAQGLFSVVWPDVYGLNDPAGLRGATHWDAASGTVLGSGDGSEAVFVDYTAVSTYLDVACDPVNSVSLSPCPNYATQAIVYPFDATALNPVMRGSTAETNNLYPVIFTTTPQCTQWINGSPDLSPGTESCKIYLQSATSY